MNETQPPTIRTPEPQTPEPQTPETRSIAKQKSLADRILAYCVIGSVVVNLGWLAWVSNSDLFGSAASLADLKPQLIKIVKPPIPQKPKPKKKEPPPPPPKQKPPPPKQRPLKPPPPRPRPVPQRITPPLHRVAVATTKNTRAVSTITVPETAPNTDTKPTASGDSPQPTPPAPAPVAATPTPAPPAPPTPAPPAPVVEKAVETPKTPPPPPPPPPKPANYDPTFERDEPAPIGEIAAPSMDNIDVSTITNTCIIAITVDEDGHAHSRVKQTSGSPEFDSRCRENCDHMRYKPAIQDHIRHSARFDQAFPIG